MNGPLVSFVVPCYKLAHYLGACLDSLLGQSYANIEVIVMDDHSPDDTAAVAAAYADKRVKYVRNDPNLGHLRNYNKGIGLASGEYIWLISADDCLRSMDALEHYVRVMEENPRLAYIFCPAMGLGPNGEETGVVEWTRAFPSRTTLTGREFMAVLADGNCVSAPAVMVRRRCYETAGSFPLDLPHAGDWYLWCAFAVLGDVAYLDEPLICYRMHGSNMSTTLLDTKRHLVRDDQAKVRWRLKEMADKASYPEVAKRCIDRLIVRYAVDFAETTPLPAPEQMTQTIEAIVEQHLATAERPGFCARLFGQLADQLFILDRFAQAQCFYREALRHQPGQRGYVIKLALLRMGGSGIAVRRMAARLRNAFAS